MRIIFFGTPFFSVPSLEKLHMSPYDIDAVVTIPDKKQGRGMMAKSSPVKKYAASAGYDIIEVDDLKSRKFIDELRSRKPDIFIVIAFKILPESVYTIPRHGSFNIHASLLPRYRGADPIRHVLLNDEMETGVSIFQIEKSVDTGPLLLRKSCNIDPEDNYDSLFGKLSLLSSQALIDFLDDFNRLNKHKVSQTTLESDNSKAYKIKEEMEYISWEQDSGEDVINKMRAFTPKPGLKTYFNNKRLTFKNISYNLNKDINLSEGSIHKIGNKIYIGTITGSIELLELQMDSKKKIEAIGFWNGFCSKNPDDNYFTS